MASNKLASALLIFYFGPMDTFKTYNRVSNLEAPWVQSCFSAFNIALLSATLVFLVLAYIDIWPWKTALLATIITAIITASLKLLDIKRSRHCQQCHSEIGHIDRELLLSPQYLAMDGIKQGNSFYTQCRWGNRPFITRWAKISHRARACHHCRLSETGYYQYFESVSAEQLRQLKSQ